MDGMTTTNVICHVVCFDRLPGASNSIVGDVSSTEVIHGSGVSPLGSNRGIAVVHALVAPYHWLHLIILEPMLLDVDVVDERRSELQRAAHVACFSDAA